MTKKYIDISRSLLLYLFYGILASILISQLVTLQMTHSQKYTGYANNNARKTYQEPQPSGRIFDRNSKIIVDSKPCYHLILKAGQRKSLQSALSFLEQQNMTFDPKLIETQISSYPSWYPITLLRDMNQSTLSQLSFYLHEQQQLSIESSSKRHYDGGRAFGLLTGYLKEDIVKRQFVAHGGIESAFATTLGGFPTAYEIKKTARNKVYYMNQTDQGGPGNDLYLTIDKNLQQFGYQLFEKHQCSGTLVALDSRTGEVLALVSAPGFDAQHIEREISTIASRDDNPLFPRALKGVYPPASLLKPLIGLAALEEGLIDTRTSMYDPGFYTLPNHTRQYKDWKAEGHGQVNIEKAIRESCDTFFYDLGFKLGIDKMSSWIERFGLGSSIDTLGLPNESGLVPNRQWKLEAKGESWYKGESLITAIGQGYTNATALQLVQMGSIFANKGYCYKPTLIPGTPREKIVVDLENKNIWNFIHRSLIGVVNHPHGTAYRRLLPYQNLHIAGKTGTAQVVSMKTLQSQSECKVWQDHSLFMGYAPYDNPKIVIVVISEHQPEALPIAGEFLSKFFNPDS